MVDWWEMSVQDKLPLTFCYGRAYMFQQHNAKWHAVSIKTARLYNKRRLCIGCLNRFSLPKVQQLVSYVPRHLWTQSFWYNSHSRKITHIAVFSATHRLNKRQQQSKASPYMSKHESVSPFNSVMNDWKPFTTILRLRHWNDFYFFRSITLFCSYFIIQSFNIS